MDDLSAAAESSLRLQDVATFVEVNCESLSQQESLRKCLEGLSVPDMLLLIFFLHLQKKYVNRVVRSNQREPLT